VTFFLALALVSLALTVTGPTSTSPVVVWTKPSNLSPSYYGPPGALSISVGTNGVYVGGGDELRKYDFDGNIVWTTQIVAGPFDIVTSVAVGTRGVYVVGNEGTNAFVALYDFNGAMVWTRFFEPGLVAAATSVSADSSAVYVAGAVETPNTGYAFVVKFDLNGNELWTQRTQSRLATAISVGPKAVYVAEHTQIFSRCHDCPFFTDTFFTAIDSDGNTLWTRQLNNETLDIECFCSSTLSVGPTGIYVEDNTVLQTPHGQFAHISFIRKYDFGGNEIWSRFISSWTASNPITGISANSKGAYVAGDAFVQHLDPSGNEVWTLHTEGQVLRAVSVSNRGIFVAGFPSIDKLCASISCIHN
jgi:hypothetical protein